MKQQLERLLANLFGLVFLGLSFLVTIETVLRKVLNFSLQGAAELGGYALAVGSAIGFGLAVHQPQPHPRRCFPRALSAGAAGLHELAVGRDAGCARPVPGRRVLARGQQDASSTAARRRRPGPRR